MDIEVVADSILESPKGEEYDGDVLMASEASRARDVPGPSSTYMPPANPDPLAASASASATSAGPSSSKPRPRPVSPTLPDLDDDEDEVVACLPVYISPALHPSLALFQYPLQHRSLRVPQWAGDRGKRITSRVKEGVGRVEVEVPVDADPKVWREERARDLGFIPDPSAAAGAAAANGHSGTDSDRRKKDVKWGDKMRLRSENVPAKEGTYFSGLVHDGALHLHPISRMLQFRTSLAYLDDFDAKNRPRAQEEDDKKRAAQRKDLPKGLDDPSNDGSGSIKDFRNKMWSMAAREDEEKWVPYEWHDAVDDERVVESLESLLVPEDRRDMLECKTRALDYLNRQHY